MNTTTAGAIQIITNLIGTPTNYIINSQGNIVPMYDTEYILKGIILVIFVITLCRIILSFGKIAFKKG
jgi:hypothetical protein